MGCLQEQLNGQFPELKKGDQPLECDESGCDLHYKYVIGKTLEPIRCNCGLPHENPKPTNYTGTLGNGVCKEVWDWWTDSGNE